MIPRKINAYLVNLLYLCSIVRLTNNFMFSERVEVSSAGLAEKDIITCVGFNKYILSRN